MSREAHVCIKAELWRGLVTWAKTNNSLSSFIRGIVFKGKFSYQVDLDSQGVEGLIIPVPLFKEGCMECELALNGAFHTFGFNYVCTVYVLFLSLNLLPIKLIF